MNSERRDYIHDSIIDAMRNLGRIIVSIDGLSASLDMYDDMHHDKMAHAASVQLKVCIDIIGRANKSLTEAVSALRREPVNED